MKKISHSNSLPVLQIPTPCPMQWDQLNGGDQKRFCDQCNKHVYNFSEMPAEEIDLVLKSSAQSSQSVCAQIRRLPNGQILTADDKPQLKQSTWGNRLATLVASLMVLVNFSGCESDLVSRLLPWWPNGSHAGEELGDIAIEPPPAIGGKVVVELGDVAVEAPPEEPGISQE